MDLQLQIETYKEMVLIRKFEEMAAHMYEKGRIRGFLHLYIGQEAVAAGFFAPIRPDDYVIGAYREHGQALSRCAEPRKLMAELFGKSTGVSSGKGGSMHLFDKNRRFLGGTGIVGGGLPIACGAGFAINYRDGDQVVLCFFGDGAVNEGSFHESLNLAAVWNLPVVFICENNHYGMGTSVDRVSSTPNMLQRAQCYAMEVFSVDGMDVLKVYDVAEKAISSARKKNPVFVEAVTYRFRGHSMSDPGSYRSKEEIDLWRERDPVANFAKHLILEEILTPTQISKIDTQVDEVIMEAVEFAETSPTPKPEDLYSFVYSKDGGL